jgi:hypothetical protein
MAWVCVFLGGRRLFKSDEVIYWRAATHTILFHTVRRPDLLSLLIRGIDFPRLVSDYIWPLHQLLHV